MTKEEAIKKIKEAMPTMWKETKDAVETLVPELAESEDERMLREIKRYIKEQGDKPTGLPNGTVAISDMIAWLEKQKEHKPSGETNVEPDSKIPREEYLYHLLANHIITFTDYTYLIAKKPFDYECANIPQKDYTPVEQKSADLSEMMVHKEPYIAPVPTPMVADEQKPVDYEAELKKCKDNPLYFYDKYVSIKQKSAEWDKLQEVFRNINEAFEDGKKEVVEHPKKYGLCKPTEWSEEDERMLSRCIKSIETSKQFADSDTFKVAKDKEINWLRALAEKMGFHKCKIGEIVTEWKKEDIDDKMLSKPKQEWSEEDEKIAKEIEEELWYPGDFPDYPSKEESELYDDCQRRLDWFKNKLKFLRPQPKQEWNEDKNKLDKIHLTVQRFIKTIK